MAPKKKRNPLDSISAVKSLKSDGQNPLAGAQLKRAVGRAKATGDKSLFDQAKGIADHVGEAAPNLVGKALEVLDLPRSAVVSGLDTIEHGGNFDQFLQGIKQHEGFGKLVEKDLGGSTAPLWLKRGYGLAGDLALDPLQYVGVGEVADGANAGRKFANIEAADVADRVLNSADKFGGEAAARDVANTVLEKSPAKIGNDELAKIGVKSGVTVPSLSGGRAVIPGTEAVTRVVGDAKAAVKGGLGSVVDRLVSPETLNKFETIPGSRQLRRAGDFLGAHELKKATEARNIAKRQFQYEAKTSLGKAVAGTEHFGKDELATLRRAIESPETVTDADRIVLDGADQRLRDWFQSVRKHAEELTGERIPELDNYLPHRVAPENADLLEGARSGAKQSFERKRTIQGTIDSINADMAAKHGVDAKVIFEDNPLALASRYADEVSRFVERHAFTNELVTRGAVTSMDDAKAAYEAVVQHAVGGTRSAKGALQAVKDRLSTVGSEKSKIERTLADLPDTAGAEQAVTTTKADLQEALDAHQALKDAAKGAKAPVKDLRAAEAKVARAQAAHDAAVAAQNEAAASPFVDLANKLDYSAADATDHASVARDAQAKIANATAQEVAHTARAEAVRASASMDRPAILDEAKKLQRALADEAVKSPTLHGTVDLAKYGLDHLGTNGTVRAVEAERTLLDRAAALKNALGGNTEGLLSRAQKFQVSDAEEEAARWAKHRQAQEGKLANAQAEVAKLDAPAEPKVTDEVPPDQRSDPGAYASDAPKVKAAQNVKKAQERLQTAHVELTREQALHDSAIGAMNGAKETVAANEARIGELKGALRDAKGAVKDSLKAEATFRSRAARLFDLADAEKNDTAKVVARLEGLALTGEGQLAFLTRQADKLNGDLDMARKLLSDAVSQRRMVDTWTDGLRELTIGHDLWAEPEMADAIDAITELSKPAKARGLLRTIDTVQSRWRAYALLSPGYHVRNFYGGVFNNALAGVKLDMYLRWGKALHEFESAAKAGLDGLSAVKDPEMRRVVEQALRHGDFMQLHEGQQLRDLADVWSGGQAVKRGLLPEAAANVDPTNLHNFALRMNVKGAESVERHLRGTLFADYLLNKGRSVDEALAAVTKFHFDYGELSEFERGTMKRIAAFYTWTRKNFPLQIEYMLRKPGIYNRYTAFKRNMELGVPDEAVVPAYYASLLGIHTPFTLSDSAPGPLRGEQGANVYLTPDLPFQNLSETFSVNTLEGQLSPLIKTPIELAAGKQLQEQIPLTNKRQVLPTTWNFLIPFLAVADKLPTSFGLPTAHRYKGQWLISNRDAYKIEQALPTLGRIRRLWPSESRFQKRTISSWLSFFLGASLRANDSSSQDSELSRRQAAIDSAVAQWYQDHPDFKRPKSGKGHAAIDKQFKWSA